MEKQIVCPGFKPTEMMTFSRKAIDYLAPRAELIELRDIAHALANVNRYGGHLRVKAHSVAAHSIDVSLVLKRWGHDAKMQFTGLMHDAAEAYIGDAVSPMKRAMRAINAEAFVEEGMIRRSAPNPYDVLEQRFRAAIGERFGIELDPMPTVVDEADGYVFRSEDIALRGIQHDLGHREPWMLFHPASADGAEWSFIERANELMEQIGG